MENRYIMVLVSAPSNNVARQIAQALLEKRLAACVNISSPVNSQYIWHGSISDDEEVLLFIKTRAALFFDHLVPMIQSLHPYDVPEIIALPISFGSQKYLDWIDESTQPL
jgi:periplasmic divalent cation tolerance protein